MEIWMQLSSDEYKLPTAVADSREELANMCGVRPDSILVSIYRSRKGIMPEKYCRVVVPDEECQEGEKNIDKTDNNM